MDTGQTCRELRSHAKCEVLSRVPRNQNAGVSVQSEGRVGMLLSLQDRGSTMFLWSVASPAGIET